MSWNHRVVRLDNHLRIYDVYYDEEGRPVSRHEAPTYVSGETIEALREQLQLLERAIALPILNDADIAQPAPPDAP